MRTAKSCKIILTVIALVMALTSCILFANFKTAHAAEVATSYVTTQNADAEFTTVGEGEDEYRALKVSAVKSETKDTGVLTFRNNLVIDDLAIEFGSIADEIDSIEITITAKSYIVTGNKNDDGEFKTSIVNTILLENKGEKDWTVKLNGANQGQKEDAGEGFTLYVKVLNNFLGYSVDGTNFTYETKSFYKVETIDKTVTTTGISFSAKVNEDAENGEYDFTIKSINQKATEGGNENNYKQSFEVNENGQIAKYAKPLVKISDSFFTRTADGKYHTIVYNGTMYTVTYTVYSFFGGKIEESVTATASNVAPDDVDGLKAYTAKKLQFNVKAEDIVNENNVITLRIGYKKSNSDFISFSTYDVKVVNKTDDVTAPKYFAVADNLDAIESFENALKDKYTTTSIVDNGEVEHSVVLGESIELPSLKSLVYDDTSSYDELKYTLHYYGPNTSTTGTSSTLKITLNAAGTYTFYVAFKDANGNEMETADFFEKDGDNYNYGIYCVDTANSTADVTAYDVEAQNYVYRFKVDDDAPIAVVAPSAESVGTGNVGTQYTAPDFDINASGFDTSYELFYNANKTAGRNDNGWISIPKASSVSTNKDYDDGNYTYEELMAIAYDGALQFTPDKEGAYMIKCTVTSNVSTRSETAYQIIVVETSKKSVDPSEPLPLKTVLAIIFLIVGSLCLIGIVVLLFVKPKEKTAEVVDKAKKNNNK